MPQYTLIGTPFSTYTRSIALGLTYKGITFDQVNVVPHSDVARAHHPFGFLPTLLIRGVEVGEDKVDVKLRESQAIVRYIDRVRPEPTLHIADGAAHAVLAEQMWEFVGFAGAHGFPAVEIGVVKPRLAATDAHQSESDIQTLLAPGVSSLQSFLATIEEHMAPEGYVFGTQLTWADFFPIPPPRGSERGARRRTVESEVTWVDGKNGGAGGREENKGGDIGRGWEAASTLSFLL